MLNSLRLGWLSRPALVEQAIARGLKEDAIVADPDPSLVRLAITHLTLMELSTVPDVLDHLVVAAQVVAPYAPQMLVLSPLTGVVLAAPFLELAALQAALSGDQSAIRFLTRPLRRVAPASRRLVRVLSRLLAFRLRCYVAASTGLGLLTVRSGQD
ncbi:MAG: hypothetical protein M1296_01950, partial [Chloroflexi bacterium]|nr:hypothetical protein [Chloroflexota bacterium]